MGKEIREQELRKRLYEGVGRCCNISEYEAIEKMIRYNPKLNGYRSEQSSPTPKDEDLPF